jgi:hypothetical protein
MHTVPDGEVLVTLGVDTHGDVHVAVALDRLGGLLGSVQVPATRPGFRQLVEWASSFGIIDRIEARVSKDRYLDQEDAGRRKKSWLKESSPWKMFPSERPVIASMSFGVRIWRCRIEDRRFGTYSESVSMTASPKASRRSSVQPPFRW